MMLFFRLLPVILSFLLMGAHLYRDNHSWIGLIAILFPLLLFIKKVWIPRLFQIVLFLGAIEWLRSLYFYIQSYEQVGKSWNNILFILGGVALFTVLSGLVFRLKNVRNIYK